jgi:tRNA (guanine37-N1)-methyltransferase
MVLMAEPLHQAIRKASSSKSHVIFLSPQGRRLNQEIAQELSRKPHLVLVCGHYEGVDERLRSDFDEEISIGDYVLTGGELPALVLADAVTRLIPGVLKKAEAVEQESFSSSFLDFPQYTRPQNWRGKKIPEVLISGNHQLIRQWRAHAAETITRLKRPDLMTQQTGRKK